MKRKLAALAAVLLAGIPVANAMRLTPAQWHEKMAQPEQSFRWAPKSKALKAEWRGADSKAKGALKAPVTETTVKLENAEGVSYLDMPDGTTWFITTEFRKDVLSENEYYKLEDIKGVTATIYNDKYEKVGYIDSDIELPEGFEYCSAAQFGPCVTKKFFNTNDSYEIMLMANFKPIDDYGAVPYTYVFSLKGADTPAEHLTTVKGYYVEAINNPTDTWSEDFFMEFFSGEKYTEDEIINTFDIYTKASYASPTAQIVKTFDVNMILTMSDGENEMMPVMLQSKGSTLYATVAKYEKTFFVNPFDYLNEELNKDNHYVIELYKKGAYERDMALQSTTLIPCEEAAEGFAMRSYCLGGFESYNDITFDFGEGENPAFIISVVDSDIYENTASRFVVYNTDGEAVKTFGEGNEGFLRLSPVAGLPEQYCMLMSTGSGEYDLEFAFYNYPEMEKVASIPVTVDYQNYTVPLSLLIDRVAEGGTYRYASASTGGMSDDNGDTSHLVAWFDRDGSMIKMDRLNGGKNINRLSPYISGNGLTRYLMNTDEAREYMMFAQRLDYVGSSAAHTELLVVNDREETLAQFTFAGDDTGINVAIVNENTNPAIWIMYKSGEDGKTHCEFLSLPLNKFDGTGSEDDPYQLRTPGDFEQIAYNLNSHFILANDIDYRGAAFKPISGTFTGSIDGSGHTVKNFTLSGSAMFANFGRVDNGQKSFVRDLTLRNVKAVDAPAVLVRDAYATTFENVNILASTAGADANSLYDFGTLVNNAAMGCQIVSCAVRADIDMPETEDVGGVVSTLGNDSKLTASSFKGSINASANAGGLAASGFSTSTISDCHATADMTAKHTIGGIIAVSDRLNITRCVVDGSITATEPRKMWSEYAGAYVPAINVGGVAGTLSSPATEYDQNGNPLAPDPALPPVISNCIVAIGSISIPDDEALLSTAHRIVGRSSVNNDPQIVGETYNEDTYEWDITWGEPAAAEEKIENNFVTGALARLDESVESHHAATEGAEVADGELNREFFENLGYNFDGYDSENPWLLGDNMTPYLHFENVVAQYMEFTPGSVSISVGETAAVTLHLEEIAFDSLTFTGTDEDNCFVNPVRMTDDGNVELEVFVNKEGAYTVTASNGAVSALLEVTGKSGVGNVTVSTLISYNGNAVNAEGCDIKLYNMQGVAVLQGRDTLDVTSLPAGVYAAVATDSVGRTRTMKINVR